MPNFHLQTQRDDVLRAALEHVHRRQPLLVVPAPPGSGKTHVLIRLGVLAVHARERVAVVTQTNAQADDFCRRMADEFPAISVHRFAASDAPDVDLGASVTMIRKGRELPHGPCLVVATGAKWATLRDNVDFDLTLVDESWQMKWADFMFLSRVSPRFVLIGDPGQIEPTVTIDTHRWETARRPPHRAAPEIVMADATLPTVVHELPVSTRLPHDTVAMVQCFYDFRFSSWAAEGERRLVVKKSRAKHGVDATIDRLRDGTVACLTLPTPEGGPPVQEDVELAGTVADLVRRLLERGSRVQTEDGVTDLRASDIGITATHRVMNARIQEALGDLAASVRVDTPERWQGLERDVMTRGAPPQRCHGPERLRSEHGSSLRDEQPPPRRSHPGCARSRRRDARVAPALRRPAGRPSGHHRPRTRATRGGVGLARGQRSPRRERSVTLSAQLRAHGFFFAPAGRHEGAEAAVARLGRPLLRTDVKPTATSRSLVCSRRELGPHTDHFRADFIAWECHASAPSGGATFVVDPAPVIAALGADDRQALSTARMIEHRIFADDPDARPVLHSPDRLYFTYWLAEGLTAAQRSAARRFRDALERAPRRLSRKLEPGDLLVVDNRRLLHGREAFAGPRHLTRIWITADESWEPRWLPAHGAPT